MEVMKLKDCKYITKDILEKVKEGIYKVREYQGQVNIFDGFRCMFEEHIQLADQKTKEKIVATKYFLHDELWPLEVRLDIDEIWTGDISVFRYEQLMEYTLKEAVYVDTYSPGFLEYYKENWETIKAIVKKVRGV